MSSTFNRGTEHYVENKVIFGWHVRVPTIYREIGSAANDTLL